MPHILLLGSEGLLGSNISYEFAKSNDLRITTAARKGSADYKFDYTPRELNELLKRVKPEVVINCIAATSPETSLKSSLLVNSILPIQLAILSRKSGFQVIHFSTNAVFSGKNLSNTERTFPFPKTKYGVTKLLGDLSAFRNLIIRTSFVGVPPLGAGSTGLVSKCKSTKLNEIIHVKDNYSWNGLTIEALIQLILVIIREPKFDNGIFHIGTPLSLSREELIKLILLRIERSDLIVKVEEKKAPKNMSLQTIKVSTVSSWWEKTEYRTVPNLTDLLKEAKFN